jgi:hypothetical protein
MKTRELIKQLQEADPTGEIEVCVGNRAIWSVWNNEAYWDGHLHILERKDPTDVWKPTGYRITNKGRKVQITVLDLPDIFLDYPDLPVEVESGAQYIKDYVEKERAEIRQILKDTEEENIRAS